MIIRPDAYRNVNTGQVKGSVTALGFPSVPGGLVNIKAQLGNVGNVYIGASDVTKTGIPTNTTTGFELDAGQETGWFPLENLNKLYIISDNANDSVIYIVLN